MKSFLLWLLATILGAGIGYGVGWLTGINLYLCIGIGVIIGSSIGITSYIHREQQAMDIDRKFETFQEEKNTNTSVSESENNKSNESKINQKES
jgi:hypothetical protein